MKRLIIRSENYDKATIILSILNEKYTRIDVEDINFLPLCKQLKCLDKHILIYFYLYEDNDQLLNFDFIDYLYVSNNKLSTKYIKYNPKIIRIITFGTYDLFHHGHFNLFKRCKEYGFYLIVGVSSDILNMQKGKKSINNLDTRLKDVKQNLYVDEIFVEESLEEKDNYIQKYCADLLIMGDDWKDKFDWVTCMTKYLPRTPNISTTLLKQKLTNCY